MVDSRVSEQLSPSSVYHLYFTIRYIKKIQLLRFIENKKITPNSSPHNPRSFLF